MMVSDEKSPCAVDQPECGVTLAVFQGLCFAFQKVHTRTKMQR